MIFDTHAHYDDRAYDEDRQEVLSGVFSSGVGALVNCGASLHSSVRSVELATEYDRIYAAVGVHPDDADTVDETLLEELDKLLCNKKVVAVGEIGLDYHWDKAPRFVQEQAFIMQWDLADRHGVPVVIHSRDAAEDTFRIISERYRAKGPLKADMHCYSYSREQALEYVKMGFMFGVGGVLTFKNARKLKEAVEAIPMERLMLETDCPYLAPEPMRGKRNDSSQLIRVAEVLADIKGMTTEEIIRITDSNARRFYGIE